MSRSDRSKKFVPEVLPIDPNQRWFNVAEAAQYSRASRQKIRQLIHRGLLKAVRGVGSGYLIDRADLDSFLTRQKRIIPPYRKNSHPWVARRHAENRKAAAR
jgi:excisionase family DNA binding protein